MTGDREELATVLSLAAPDAIELRHLRAFVAVAEELNFGRAAARLYLSAPALSRQIRALERLVGCELLRRTTHRVALTLAGEALLDSARKLLADLDRGIAATRSVGGELAARIAKFWAPVDGYPTPDDDLQALRDSAELMHAQFTPPPEIGMRPVNAGGVPSLLLAPRPEARPTMLQLHGGCYVACSALGYRPLAGAVAAASDTGVLVPEYRLAPEHPFPAAVEDAMRAYLWMVDSGVPPGQVTLVGDSAGAGLALSLLLSLREQNLPLPGGAALLCPGVDPTCSTLRDLLSPDGQLILTVEQIRHCYELYLDEHPIDDPVVSPLLADLTGLPPMLIQVGTGDIVVEDTHRLAERARDHGVDVRLELYPADTHVFHLFWSFLPEAADAVAQVGRFAKEIRGGVTTAETDSGSAR